MEWVGYLKNNILTKLIKMEHYDKKYWAKRAKDYNKTEWVKNEKFIDSYLSMLPNQKFETILEVGIGTGAVAEKMVETK